MSNAAASAAAGFPAILQQWQQRIEAALNACLPHHSTSPARLHEAMRYSVLGSGKRVRPALVYATGKTLGLSESMVDSAAVAVEMIHAYSLIHDDLPAMDDDDLRRGRPTCHKAFDEATAILAGDALQVLAFSVLANSQQLDPSVRVTLIGLLAHASGTFGMAGGQALDLAAAGKNIGLDSINEIHDRKTGALISASVLMAAACKPDLEASSLEALANYARCIGLAFQIQDDLLDIEGDPSVLGKATGADQMHNKPTYPKIAGVAQAHAEVKRLHNQGIAALASFGSHASLLKDLADWLVLRKH